MYTIPYINRDLSWLSFNHRVLQEAQDEQVPLFERLKFLAIYSSNLDEFFRIRVASTRNLISLDKKTKEQLEYNPKQLLKAIHKEVNRQQEEFSATWEQLEKKLAENQIFLLRRLDLNPEQKEEVEAYFKEKMLPYVMPTLLVKKRIRPFLANANIYLAVHLKQKGKPYPASEYALVRVPTDQMPRFVQLESHQGKHFIIMLDDIVRHSLSWLFPGYDIQDAYSVKLTRDAELYIDSEHEGNLVEKVKESLAKRLVGPPSRFVYDREMPKAMLDYLADTFDLTRFDILPEGRYHNNFDFFKFPSFDINAGKYRPLPPLPHPTLHPDTKMFEAIKEKDRLIHMPYQDYAPVVELFQQAAKDPLVTHIKVVQYRVSKKSKILETLIDAVRAGKQVSVFVEIKARFDEETNLEWGEKLTKAGVRVHYSMPGVKVHAKLALIRRKENGKTQLYAYLSSGNFHEDTAKIYGDWGLFTVDERLTKDVSSVFAFLENSKIDRKSFDHLLVGKYNLREGFYALIDREIHHARSGKPAEIFLKMNSLQDVEMIARLYQASQAGVRIRLIVRGICCLIPGVRGFSENIEAISIVDRFLEHSRVMIFHNLGAKDTYISSADFMTRNLSYRVETAFPLFDPAVRQEVHEIMELQWSDNVKARVFDSNCSNDYRRDGNADSVRSQIDTYHYYKRKLAE